MPNFAAIAYALLAHDLAVREVFSLRTADQPVWIIAFPPASFVLAMGYAEGLNGVLTCLVLRRTRSHQWAGAAAAGLLAGALRPTGVVLVLPILTEALRGRSTVRWPQLI